MYNLSRKIAYLKSEIVKNGPFRTIFRLFIDFARFCRYEWEAGLKDWARGDGRGLKIARGDGRGLEIARGDGRGLAYA